MRLPYRLSARPRHQDSYRPGRSQLRKPGAAKRGLLPLACVAGILHSGCATLETRLGSPPTENTPFAATGRVPEKVGAFCEWIGDVEPVDEPSAFILGMAIVGYPFVEFATALVSDIVLLPVDLAVRSSAARAASAEARDFERACRSGDANIIDPYLCGGGVNARTPAGVTPLMVASESGNADIVRRLLAMGAHVDMVDDKGRTALMFASEKGHLDVVELLLGVRARVNARSGSSRTALIFASSRGNLEVVNALLLAGADPSLTADRGETAFSVARRNGRAEVVRILREYESADHASGQASALRTHEVAWR